jgi:hypothetical protein
MADTYYFSHDYNARSDFKVKKLLSKHGMLGYGIFWSLVEDLYNNANALPLDCERIAFDLRTDCETITSIVQDFDLFVVIDGSFSSKSVAKRLQEREDKSTKARNSAINRWSKDANALPTQSDRNAIKERKGKERKSKEIINTPFELFWNLYNKKVGDKSKCEKKWLKLSDEERTKIMDTLPTFLNSITDKQFQPHPATYLNNKRWNDEPIAPPQPDYTNNAELDDVFYRNRLAQVKREKGLL